VRALAAQISSKAEGLGDWTGAEEAAEVLLRLTPRDETALRRCLRAKALAGKVREAEARYAGYRETALLLDASWEPAAETTSLLSELDELAARGVSAVDPRIQSSPDPPLVGREIEMSVLRDILRGPWKGRFETLVVTGERGIGKSRIVREALARSPGPTMRVLEGRCSEFERNIPLNPLLEALSQPWIAGHLRAVSTPWRELLLALLPELARESDLPGAMLPESPQDVPRATCEAILRLLERLARDKSVVLFIDDLHWLDATSFSVLQYVRERWIQGSLLLITTIRPEEVDRDAPLNRWLRKGGERHTPARELHIGPLDVEETTRLIRSAIEIDRSGDSDPANFQARIASLAESVGGHPLLAIESARHLHAPISGEWSIPPRIGLSEAVRDIVRLRLAALPPEGRSLLEALSPSPRPLPISLLRRVCGSVAQLAPALDETVRHHLLSNTTQGVGFRHELIREAIYQELKEGTKVMMHLNIADALIEDGGQGMEVDIALHLLAAGEGRRANLYALSAARAAISTGGWVEARGLLEAALSNRPTPAERESLSAQLGRLLILMGEFPKAQELWARQEEDQLGRGSREAILTARLRRLEAMFLDPDADRIALRESVAALHGEAEALGLQKLVGETMGLEVAILDRLTRPTDVREVTAEASALVGKGNPDARLQFLFVSLVDAVYGNPTRAAAMADEAIAIAKELGNPDLELRAYNWKVIAYWLEARLNLEDGLSLARDAREAITRGESPDAKFRIETNLGAWYLDAGELANADAAFNRASDFVQGLSAPHLRRTLLANRGQLALEMGDSRDAVHYFTESLGITSVADWRAEQWPTIAGMGLAYLYEGSLAEARTAYDRLPEMPVPWTFDPYLWISLGARLSLISGSSVREVTETLKAHESRLGSSFRTTWMRVRLLRFEMGLRRRVEPELAEVRELREFLMERGITERLGELDRLLARSKGRL